MKKNTLIALCLLLGMVCYSEPVHPAEVKPAGPPAGGAAPPITDQKETLPGPSPQELATFAKVKDLYENGDYELAIFNLQEFISRYPESLDLPKAYFMIGESYVKTLAFEKAVPYLRKVVEDSPTLPFRQQAMDDLALAYKELGKTDQGLGILQQLLDERQRLRKARS